MNPRLLFRRAQSRDAKMLTGIALASKRHWGYPVSWLAEWRNELTLTPEYIRAQPVYLAKQAGRIVGFFGLKNSEHGLQLDHLWLRPEYIGRGLGRVLFAESVRRARSAGAREFRIKADPNAEQFYLKMGAVRIGVETYRLLGKIRRETPLLIYYIR